MWATHTRNRTLGACFLAVWNQGTRSFDACIRQGSHQHRTQYGLSHQAFRIDKCEMFSSQRGGANSR